MAKIDRTEQARLQELKSYNILDTSSERDFDNIVKLVASICQTPIATITLIDQKREWFKASIGLEQRENDREIAFCAVAFLSEDIFLVPDTLKDPNFSTNPMVTGAPYIRFYAGMPLISPRGHSLGTLAVKDYQPRELTGLQLDSLRTLAAQVVVQLESRRQNSILERLSQQRDHINQKLSLQSAKLEKEREFLSALLESLSEGIAACDEKGKLSLFNNTTRQLHGLDEEKLPPEKWAQHYDLFLADGKTRMSVDQIPLFRAYAGEKVVQEELVIAPKNDQRRIVLCNGQPILRSDGKKLGAVIAMRDITEQKAKETALAKSEAKLSAIFNQSYLFQGLMEVDGTVIDVNQIALQACGYQRDAEIGKKFWETSWWNQDPAIAAYVQDVVVKGQNGEVVHASTDYHVASGERRQTEFILTPIRDALGHVTYLLVSGQDVTDRKKSEADLANLNRTLRLLSKSNELLIRTKTESKLLTEICELIVKYGGYDMAWVGYRFEDEAKSIKPVAHFGDFSHLSSIQHTWADSIDPENDPILKTLRTRQPVIIADILKSDASESCSAVLSTNGYRGLICLPLVHEDAVFGLLTMYTEQIFQSEPNEITLLQKLADDLVFGIMNIRAQEESQRFHTALYKMAASVSASTDNEFFLQLTRNMTESIGADAGFIAQVISNEPHTARTLAAIVDGEKIDNIEYALIDSPCKHLLESATFTLSELREDCFSPSETMILLGMKDYIGQQILNSKNEVIGMLFVMTREFAKQTDVAISLLKIFATRAGAELDRRVSDQHIREQASLLDKAQDAIMVRGLDNIVKFWNKGAERLYGWTKEEAIGTSIERLIYPDTTFFDANMHTLLEEGEWSGEIEQSSKLGEKLVIESHWTLVVDDHGQPQSVFTINTNITDRKAAADKIQYLAFYDHLTNLPNRTLLLDRLKKALASCTRNQSYGALLFIDIDNFKILNDTLGHDKGDLLLNQIGERLKNCVRTTDSVARFGGDEFVIMLENISSIETQAAIATQKIAEKVMYELNQPYYLGEYEHQSTASIGITLFSEADDSINELLKRADLAMYQAKAMGRNALRFFDPAMQSEITARVLLESDLRQSIANNQFLLHYQPQLNHEGAVVGAEALIRWQHPQRGMVSPAIFIPLAEESRMILAIGQWVLKTACQKLAEWSKHPHTMNLTLAVNVSVRQFRQPDFVEQVLAAIDEFGTNPYRLKLELTESLFAENVEDIISKMHRLKERGISFSLDDFGTGYSSLTYLKRMPLDQLKIDQSFVRDVLVDLNDATIAKTIIGLAKSLGLEVIAEGVETELQKNFLYKSGCYVYQGYFFSKPLPEALFEEYLTKSSK